MVLRLLREPAPGRGAAERQELRGRRVEPVEADHVDPVTDVLEGIDERGDNARLVILDEEFASDGVVRGEIDPNDRDSSDAPPPDRQGRYPDQVGATPRQADEWRAAVVTRVVSIPAGKKIEGRDVGPLPDPVLERPPLPLD